ncbi:SDR family NAD(P)-dependent oxidoreductase [Clostridium septicum]|uniref:NAD(P)-dependent oxidoreductase n=1 Tax=Clostridium septicum TaxID=1504 RepID=A0A9N7JKM6_CLOSE|nr:SDR family oxidoreductase [Clostridium septicum]AYE34378.1 NAD(P)-dependent oxidoreductase [Clostridium septicum]QAS59784.1 SDR family oxidoreductase [Clostridium septicum]UEC20980.1 SDR family oxidoreductase [Clostridium septicum]USS00971.1 SDR family oxidoreductase [Clostridium septicum]
MEKMHAKKYVLITGASLGIGKELCKLYAKDGYNLILVARDIDKLKQLKDELKKYNICVEILSVDLTGDKSCEQVIDFVNKKSLSVDILINNAGIGSFGYLSEIDVNKELSLIDINIRALTELTKYFLKDMIKNNNGAIMNVASTAAFCAGPKMATYYASKAYVLSFTEALYEEVKDKGIKVSCLCPGAVNTTFQGKAGIKKRNGADKNLMSVNKVAEIGYKNFNKGKLIIIPGFKNKLLVLINKLLPRAISRKVILMMNKE